MAYLATVLQTNAIIDGVYNVTFSVFQNYLSPTYTALIAEYGEPTIAIGGLYSPPSPVPSFTLPVTILRLTSDLPVTYLFDPANPILSPLYTEEQAQYFAVQFVCSFNAAVLALSSNIDSFSGQTLQNFPNPTNNTGYTCSTS